jgi:hypothetical protein
VNSPGKIVEANGSLLMLFVCKHSGYRRFTVRGRLLGKAQLRTNQKKAERKPHRIIAINLRKCT